MSDIKLEGVSHTTLAADVVAAYVSNNKLEARDLPSLIQSVFDGIAHAAAPKQLAEDVAPKQEPAVPIKKSVTPDYIISLEDGRKFKSMKRYLMTSHGMTPEQYRAKWGLPSDYPMVAPNYAGTRSALAKSMGLGQVREGKKSGRKPKAALAR